MGGINQFGPSMPGVGAGFEPTLARRIPDTASQEHSILENAVVLCVLVFSTSAFVNFFPGEHGLEHEEEGLLFAQFLWSFLYLALLFLARKRIVKFAIRVWDDDKVLVSLLCWACVSALWSIDAQVTIRHFVALLFTTFFGVYLAVRYSLREQLRLVSLALGVVVVASVVTCLALPEYGIDSKNPLEAPAWQGVLSDKNNLATLLILALLILILYFIRGIGRSLIVGGIVLVFILVVLTQSKTSLVYFPLSIVAFPFVRAFQRNPSKRRKLVAVVLLLALGIAAWTYANWESFTYSLGRDPGLTGRFVLWGVAMESISQKPLLGYGFEAFWSNYYGPANDYRVASGWTTGATTQNAFLNLWLDLGLVGVLLFVSGFFITFRRALNVAKSTKTWEGLWYITFLTFFFIYGLTEISFLTRNSLYWILYVSTALSVRSLVLKRCAQS